MAESNPKVQRTSRTQLIGVVDEAEVARLEELIEEIKTLVDLVRADVIPIAVAALNSNPQFIELMEQMDQFQASYGVTVPDMDFNLNPLFSDVESRVGLVENAITELRAVYATLTDQQNGFHQRLRVIEQRLGIPTP